MASPEYNSIKKTMRRPVAVVDMLKHTILEEVLGKPVDAASSSPSRGYLVDVDLQLVWKIEEAVEGCWSTWCRHRSDPGSVRGRF